MALPAFIARLIGDRSAVAPNLGKDVEAVGSSRFPQGIVANPHPTNPYRGWFGSREFPIIPVGTHPLAPPILRTRLRHLPITRPLTPSENVPVKTYASVGRLIPGSAPDKSIV